MLNNAFNRLVDELKGINEKLGKQLNQHETLMGKMDELPEILQSLPGAVEEQKKVVDSLIGQLKSRAFKDQQFFETVSRIPEQTLKNTNVLSEMNEKLSVSADANVQVSENFQRFNNTLDSLDKDTASQTDSIIQMGKTFSASDRYLKYIITQQNKRYLWVFVISITISTISLAGLIALVLIVLYR